MATTSLPAVDRPNADRWNAARSRQFQFSIELALNRPTGTELGKIFQAQYDL